MFDRNKNESEDNAYEEKNYDVTRWFGSSFCDCYFKTKYGCGGIQRRGRCTC